MAQETTEPKRPSTSESSSLLEVRAVSPGNRYHGAPTRICFFLTSVAGTGSTEVIFKFLIRSHAIRFASAKRPKGSHAQNVKYSGALLLSTVGGSSRTLLLTSFLLYYVFLTSLKLHLI